MKIGRTFWAVTRWARAARFWLVLLLAALAWLGFGGQAHAQSRCEFQYIPNPSNPYPDITAAVAACQAAPASGWKTTRAGGWFDGFTGRTCERHATLNRIELVYSTKHNANSPSCDYRPGAPESGRYVVQYYSFTEGCPAGTEWNPDLGKCFNPEECLQRNGAANGMPAINTSRPFKRLCRGGCWLTMEGNGPGSCTSILGQPGSMMCSGVFQYSGETCSSPPSEGEPGPDDPIPPEPEETCKDAASGGGLKVCKKNDGRECVTTKSGASICWGTHETGEKSIGNEQQARGPGNEEPTPTPPTPPETFDPAQKTPPVTTTTTTTNPNGSTTTTTTTTVSNGTTNGTQPPGTPVAPGGGSGQPGEGEDDEGNSASGGGDCDTPPVVEGDAALGMIAKQAWETRCALEKIGEGAKVTGDVGDCDSPFTVEGDDASAKELRAMRAQICPGGDAAKNGDGDAIDWSGIDGPDSAEGLGLIVEKEIGADGLDTIGLGFSRTCPVMPQVTVFGNVIQFDNSVMCDWLELGGQILLILSALVSVRILAGVGT